MVRSDEPVRLNAIFVGREPRLSALDREGHRTASGGMPVGAMQRVGQVPAQVTPHRKGC